MYGDQLKRVMALGALALLLGLVAGRPGAPARAQAQAGSPLQLVWAGTTQTRSNGLAWGDLDGDGDLDLAVASERGARLYRNDDTTLSTSAVWASLDQTQASAVAWGDIDRDGDLDLASASQSGPPRLYRNEQGALLPQSTWSPVDSSSSSSLAWGDIDGDADLDLLVGSQSQPIRLYLNSGSALSTSAAWSSPQTSATHSLALGDLDGDGDLDLALGNDGQPSQLYRNVAGSLSLDPGWQPPAANTRGLAWGDLDGDGDLDLALANFGQPSQLYRNVAGSLTTPAAWSAGSPANTIGLAWGDYDADGDPDLLVANSFGHPNHLYRNEAGTLAQEEIVLSSELDFSTSLAWGDYDGDGDLDLAVGNTYQYQAVRLYRNDIGVLMSAAGWSPPIGEVSSLAWGDYDGDGDLDLAIGNNGQPSQLYRNIAGSLSLDPGWQPPAASTTSLAWGDYDGDGDLDLAIGNNGQPSQLYRNIAGSLSLDPGWQPSAASTTSLAWGDYDGDGDLDLAIGNDGQPSQLYRNDNGALGSAAAWSSAEASFTFSLAWGDLDGDGDLDLALGNFRGPNRLYRNDAGALTTSAAWSSGETGYTRSLAWGDVDGDGDLDLAAGNARTANWLYRNDAGALTTSPTWSSSEADFTVGLAWGDVDGDGDLDLAAGNFRTPSRLYRNDAGALSASAAWSSDETGSTTSLAWGDLDGDGDLDLAIGNNTVGGSSQPTALYYSRRAELSASTSEQRGLRLLQLGPAEASLYARSQIWSSPTLSLTYQLRGPAQSRFSQILAYYSLDGGDRWRPATPSAATPTSNLLAAPGGISHSFTWDIHGSGVMGRSDSVVLRLVGISSPRPLAARLAGPYLHSAYVATSQPFRLRGSQVRVLSGSSPAQHALVYQLAAGQAARGVPYADLAGRPFRTDAQGYLQGRGALQLGDQLVALAPISSTAAYTLYHTSAQPTPSGLAGAIVAATGVQTLSVSAQNPLLLFNLSVSLEWDARQDARFLEQLEFDLTRASEHLYDWSNGQIALGELRIAHDQLNWNDADIRIYASNRFYPNAIQGGLGSTIRSDPDLPSTSYEPGQVHIGAVWNRFGSAGSSLGEDWPRVLAHELGHYALYLDDNYLGIGQDGQLIAVDSCPGAMSDPYRNDHYSEFHPAQGWLPACQQTLSHQLTGRSDWQTISAFYPALQAPAGAITELNQGPNSLPLVVTQLQFEAPGAPSSALEVPTFYLTQDGARVEPGPQAQALLFQNTQGDSAYDRLIDLGQARQDALNARGARPGDRLCLYEHGASRLGCTIVSVQSDQLALAAVAGWSPAITITPVSSDTLDIDVLDAPAGLPLYARLYPAGSPALPAIQLAQTGQGYAGTFVDMDDPVFEGHLQIWVDEPESPAPRRESVVEFTMGGNPGRVKLGGGRVKLGGGRVKLGGGRVKLGGAPMHSFNGQVELFGSDVSLEEGQLFILQRTSALPTLPVWASQVGPAYQLASSDDDPWLQQTSLSFNYDEGELPAGQEQWLTIYHWDDAAAQPAWRPIATTVDLADNRASAPTRGPGLYVMMTSVELTLLQGWNLLAYPVQGSRPAGEALASIAGLYSVVYGYAPHDALDPWKLYAPDAPPWASELEALSFGQGYWIYALQATTLRLRGEKAAPGSLAALGGMAAVAGRYGPANERAQPFLDGPGVSGGEALSTLIAQPFLPPSTFYGSLEPRDGFPGAGMEFQAWVQGALCGRGQIQQQQGALVYVVDVLADDGALAAGCGRAGQAVRFEAGGRPLLAPAQASWRNQQAQALDLSPGYRSFLPALRR